MAFCLNKYSPSRYHCAKCYYITFFADASQYAHYVFKTFKNGHTGTIKFEVKLIWRGRRSTCRRFDRRLCARGNETGIPATRGGEWRASLARQVVESIPFCLLLSTVCRTFCSRSRRPRAAPSRRRCAGSSACTTSTATGTSRKRR